MSFYPDGQTPIPEQLPVPGAHGSAPAPAPREDPVRRRTRLMVRTVAINTVILVAAVLLAYVFPISDDPDVALAMVVGAAMVCATHMATVLLLDQRRGVAEAGRSGPPPPGGVATAVPAPITSDDATAVAGFSLVVEDVFSITGRGTVITGRVLTGAVRVGMRVAIVRAGATVGSTEVTGIEMFRRTVQEASTNENVGLLLRDVTKADVQRGDVLRG